MQIAHSIRVCQEALSKLAPHATRGVALIPTMGNLHAGHLHLVNIAKQHADVLVVSIFVNPLQFGANEDLANYPRTFDADCAKLEALGVNLVFAPSVHEMYPHFDGHNLHQTVTIQAPAIAQTLCGVSRPGHFDGVATVVTKLFNIIQPDIAVFGKKDFQQLTVIESMVTQLNIPVAIMAGDTIREPSGLAMSSRNGYLTPAQREKAAFLYATLNTIVQAIQRGATDFSALIEDALVQLKSAGWQTDYVAICNRLTLEPASFHDQQLVVLAAATLGKTRLIDNIDFLR